MRTMHWIIIAAMLLLPTTILADDSAVYGVGGAVAPMKSHPTIRMVRERVDAKLGWEYAKVRCEFVFKNEGQATTVKIGFPERASGDVSAHSYSDLLGFKSWVDGKLIETKHIKSSEKTEQEYNTWHVKDVPFEAGQTRIIVDEYRARYGGISDGSRFFSYILETGANWKGSIGDALITVDASEISSYWIVRASSEKYAENITRKDDVFIWRIRNFEPTEDIGVGMDRRYKLSLDGRPLYQVHPSNKKVSKVPMVFASGFNRINRSGYRPIYVGWNGKTRTCTIKYEKRSISLGPGSKTALTNGHKKLILPIAPDYYSGSLSIPAIPVAKALGMMVEKDSKTGDINIMTPKQVRFVH